ncbi:MULTISPECIES: hypothetical protein [Streptomyces]|uniref:Uncharacterized protein n=3 Tax=Streptomyces rimosus TaxID=1927 RepID=L8EZY0_STRR1|nr:MULTISPECIES: hypothetical protein [Streptomyces]KOG73118.1 hypothetical protein ADK78_17855 [Kitasatospora aureofaciens]MYT42020.1 hypothetical protein [Streptomyces sp. SID5471]KEF04892.1 hypothetical protein DF17_21875 [Streptomyces rimosus]KEF11501.1 hypothetical protein DF18_36105 [Streptomyces rimosus]KUJ35181.1 hypothetical protein ADK46_17195 [Streptomyces rimosus subsp. rimosus]
MTRTALDRVRVSTGIAALALQQIEDELSAGTLDARQLADLLRELHHQAHPRDGVFGFLAQLLTTAAHAAERIESECGGDACGPLHEAAAHLTDTAGMRIHRATRDLDPEGERS